MTDCGGCRKWRRIAERRKRQNMRLRRRIQKLKTQLEVALRAAKRQAAPFSRGSPKPQPLKPGRRPGKAYGRRARRPIPDHIDETIEVPLPLCCPHCHEGPVQCESVVEQYETDIPPVQPHVTRLRIHQGRCGKCGRRVRGHHPRQTSQAVGAAASHLGPRAVALAADLNKRLGVSYGKMVVLYQVAFGLTVSRGGLCLALERLARAAEPTYRGLIAIVHRSPVVAPDETGWKVGGLLNWLWVFVTAQVTVYSIQPGRGFEEATAILPPDFAGTLERDGWAVYRRFSQAWHQSCLNHLLWRCHGLLEHAERGEARFPLAVQRVLMASLQLRHDVTVGRISPHGRAVARGQLESRMDRVLAGRILHPPNRRLARHLRREQPYLFTFLGRNDVEATNWRAEQAIRPAVVTRKVWGGNRTWPGAKTQEILASVLRTCQQNRHDPLDLFTEMLRRDRPVSLVARILNTRTRSP